jgi:aspartate/methionine/tyrosine aminotransferase
VQHAGVAALEGPQDFVETMRDELLARRALLVEGLNALPGVRCAVPAGAFYAFPDVSALPLSAERVAEELLESAGVATLAGTAFGAGGAGHLRLSYATSRDHLVEALLRVSDYVAGLAEPTGR